jgi:hypothetical protein
MEEAVFYMIRILSCVNIALAYFDVVTTNRVINSGVGHEANPVMRAVMRAMGQKWVIGRFLFTMFAVYSAFNKSPVILAYPWIPLVSLGIGCIATGYAVWSNNRLAHQP